MVDYYSLLGVSFSATPNEIKEAYRRKTKTTHPDKGGTDKEFILLQNAFQTLMDDQKRKAYDEEYATFYQNLWMTNSRNENTQTTNFREEKSFYQHQPFPSMQEEPKKKKRGWLIFSILANLCLLIGIVFLWITYQTNHKTVSALELERNKTSSQLNTINQKLNKVASKNEELQNENQKLQKSVKAAENSAKSVAATDSTTTTDLNADASSSSTSSQNANSEAPTTPVVRAPKGYFTVGSSEEEVKKVQGTPSSIIGDNWGYGLSTVYFSGGVVSGWNAIDQPLKMFIPKTANKSAFGVGDSKQDVVNVMGTPTSIIGDTYQYGLSSVYFSGDDVSGWSQIDKHLKVK